jgi:hypothetical protein
MKRTPPIQRRVGRAACECDEALGEALPTIDPARTGEALATVARTEAWGSGVGTGERYVVSSWASSPK